MLTTLILMKVEMLTTCGWNVGRCWEPPCFWVQGALLL